MRPLGEEERGSCEDGRGEVAAAGGEIREGDGGSGFIAPRLGFARARERWRSLEPVPLGHAAVIRDVEQVAWLGSRASAFRPRGQGGVRGYGHWLASEKRRVGFLRRWLPLTESSDCPDGRSGLEEEDDTAPLENVGAESEKKETASSALLMAAAGKRAHAQGHAHDGESIRGSGMLRT